MSGMPNLRWGILGCTRITRKLVPAIRGAGYGTVVALASRDAARAKSWAAEMGIPRAHGSYADLVADAELDAVYIPLTNELHRPWTLAAADTGKHVLCEKPLALDARQAAEMVEHCRKRGVILMEAAMWRHQPRTVELRRRLADGVIGALRLVRTSFSFPINPADWRLNPEQGGGALLDIGTYGTNAARLYAGSEPLSVRGFARNGPSGVDMTDTFAIQFPNGVLGQVDCSFESAYRCRYELVGSTGSIEVPDAFLPPPEPRALIRDADGKLVEELSFDGRDQYAAMVEAFTRAVAQGQLPEPAENGLAQMQALDMVRAALA